MKGKEGEGISRKGGRRDGEGEGKVVMVLVILWMADMVTKPVTWRLYMSQTRDTQTKLLKQMPN